MFDAGFSPIPGLYIGFTPVVVAGFEAEVELSGELSASLGISADSETEKIKDISKNPELSLSAKTEGKVFVGFDLKPEITIVSEKVCEVSTAAKAGIEIDATLSKEVTSETETDVDKIDRVHDCKACVDGDLNFVSSVEFELKLPFCTKFELSILDNKQKFADFYWSIDHNEIGFLEECPHQIQRVTFKVVDSDGEPVSGAEMAFSSDTAVKTMEFLYLPKPVTGTLKTDKNGEVSVFLGMGETEVTVSKDGYETAEKSFETEISQADIFRINGEIRTDGYIFMYPAEHTFTVRVTDPDGNKISHAKLSCNEYTTPEYTDSYGQASLRLPDGDYKFKVEKNGEVKTFSVKIQGEDAEEEIVLGEQSEPGTTEPGETEPAVADVKNRLSMGDDHSAYITEDGSLYMWGDNGSGQLGDGTGVNKSTPVKIMDNVVSVSLGGDHSAAITTDGSLYTWGENGYGQLGDGTTEDKLEPTKIMDNVAAVSLEYRPSAAITADGSLYTWGCNEYGQFGDGTTEDKLEPTKIMDNVASVSLGWYHSAAITTDGSLYTWGDNYYGQLGDGTHEDKSIPVKIMDNVASVSLGGYHSAAITTDGSLYTWGFNWWGQLGDGTMESKLTPVKIMDNVAAVSLGGGNSAAITTDGSLYMWGSNAYGMLGDGTTEGKLTPVKIMDDVVSVSLGGGAHRAAITTDGSLYTWGDNDYGQLGDGTTEDKLVPTKIKVPAGEPQTAALTYNSAEILADEPETTALTDLLPDTVYNYYVLCTDKGEKLLKSANIQYIAQFTTDEAGSAEIDMGLTEISEDSVKIAVPAEKGLKVDCGDVNQDGMIDASDASQILAIYAVYSTGGTPEETEQQLLLADVNADGMADASDASTVLAYYAYLSTGGTVDIETFMTSDVA